MAYTAQITVWSRIGHTPITKRPGSYCDVLVETEVLCDGPTDARRVTLAIKHAHPHADRAYFYMPTYPNQNTRSNWF